MLVIIILLFTADCQSAIAKQPCIILLCSVTTCRQHVNYYWIKCKLNLRMITMKIISVNNEPEFNTVVNFVSRAFSRYQDNITGCDCSEVIGVVGDLDLKTANIIHTLASRANVSITLVSAVAPSTFQPTTNLVLPNLLHMNPFTHYVEALVAFFDHLNWTRIGLISDDTYYYEFAAELLQQKLLENTERRIIPFVRISERDNRTKTIQTFKEYQTDVIVISTNDKVACSLIQEAKKVGFTWPEYAWIIFDIRFHSSIETCQDEGVILLRDQNILEESNNNHVRCRYRDTNMLFNSSILLNSILAISLADSKSLLNASFLGVAGQVKFKAGRRLNNISIVRKDRSGFREEIAFYDTESNMLSYFAVASDKPCGSTLKKYFHDFNSTLRITLVNLIFIFLFVFVTIVFILYMCFRKEPEIRATSVTVSLCMFLGCYILISYFPLLVIDPTISLHCHLLVWLSLGGIPFPLIMATLFAKMLRVYLIFFDPLSYKKKFFSDPLLFLYILLLVSPSFLILVIWSSYDPHMLHEVKSPQDNYVFIYGRCLSNHTIKWLGTLLTYYFLLSIILVCLALKTSKIRYKHFRDTKATNAFVYLSCFLITLTLIYWYFFRLQELKDTTLLITSGVLYTGHGSIAILCQILLFVPKVYLPLKRRLTRYRVKSKIAS